MKAIHSFQRNHFFMYNTYSLDFETIDFIPPKIPSEGGNAHYTYEIIEATASTFKARINALFDSDADGVMSTWEIDENGNPKEIIRDSIPLSSQLIFGYKLNFLFDLKEFVVSILGEYLIGHTHHNPNTINGLLKL